MSKKELLSKLDFGQRIAEEEGDALSNYFVETDNWRRLYSGDIDVVYGPKGSGKSALYSLLVARTNTLFDRNILLAPGENPRGATAFSDLVADPPVTEREFVSLWKLYFCTLLSGAVEEYGLGGEHAAKLRAALEFEGLVKGKRTLQSVLHDAFDYVKRLLRPKELEGGVKIDPVSGLPIGFTGKIIFGEPSQRQKEQGQVSVDALLSLADQALKISGYKVWILLDRLDVAFVESQELEHNALRALFRVYLDLGALENVRIKIFLRSDIWNRITDGGFREASHITKHVTIHWDSNALLNLVARRLLHNAPLIDHYKIDGATVLASAKSQSEFFYRVFPDQIDLGGRKPSTLDWMLSRTQDGSQKTAPRELIHLLNELRATQAKRFEVGQQEPEGEALFERATFKEALPEVSKVRLTQTIYAEYPGIKDRLEALRGAKTSHTTDSLATIWKQSTSDARRQADVLAEIGFFEKRGERDAPEYWVPFLYRDALDMVQGAAD